MSPTKQDPCEQEVERRLDMAKEQHDFRIVYEREMHEVKMELERAKVRGVENGNAKPKPQHPILQWIGVPGAFLALATVLVLYHTNIAMPSVRAATREAIQQLLSDPSFWAQVKVIARDESHIIVDDHTGMIKQEMESLRQRLSADEAVINENTRYLDSLGRRKLVGNK